MCTSPPSLSANPDPSLHRSIIDLMQVSLSFPSGNPTSSVYRIIFAAKSAHSMYGGPPGETENPLSGTTHLLSSSRTARSASGGKRGTLSKDSPGIQISIIDSGIEFTEHL